jgi:hypothetical protein
MVVVFREKVTVQVRPFGREIMCFEEGVPIDLALSLGGSDSSVRYARVKVARLLNVSPEGLRIWLGTRMNTGKQLRDSQLLERLGLNDGSSLAVSWSRFDAATSLATFSSASTKADKFPLGTGVASRSGKGGWGDWPPLKALKKPMVSFNPSFDPAAAADTTEASGAADTVDPYRDPERGWVVV